MWFSLGECNGFLPQTLGSNYLNSIQEFAWFKPSTLWTTGMLFISVLVCFFKKHFSLFPLFLSFQALDTHFPLGICWAPLDLCFQACSAWKHNLMESCSRAFPTSLCECSWELVLSILWERDPREEGSQEWHLIRETKVWENLWDTGNSHFSGIWKVLAPEAVEPLDKNGFS